MWIDRAITGKITNEKGGETKQPKMFGKKIPPRIFFWENVKLAAVRILPSWICAWEIVLSCSIMRI